MLMTERIRGRPGPAVRDFGKETAWRRHTASLARSALRQLMIPIARVPPNTQFELRIKSTTKISTTPDSMEARK